MLTISSSKVYVDLYSALSRLISKALVLRLTVSVEHGLVADRQTHEYGIYRASIALRSKKMTVLDGKYSAKPKTRPTWPTIR